MSKPSPPPAIRCEAILLRPARSADAPVAESPPDWAFLRLPPNASQALPSRGLVAIDGTLAGVAFAATLQPDGEGGHWLKIEPDLLRASGATAGARVALVFSLAAHEPEPTMPESLRAALDAAPARAREVWSEITPAARRDFIFWIESAKKDETRVKRTATACDMLAKGKRRPCCFDRSGMYGKSLSCPAAEPLPAPVKRRR
jgi:hypothetical protein